MGDGCHRSLRHRQGIVPFGRRSQALRQSTGHRAKWRLGNASTCASPRVSRDPAQIISLGQRLGFVSEGGGWRWFSSRIQRYQSTA